MARKRSAVTVGRLRKVGAEVGIEGVDEIKAAIADKMDRMTGMAAKKVFMRAAMRLVDEMKDIVPVKTGLLKSAIFAAYGDPKKPNVIAGVKAKKAPHAHLVEYGHGGPHPAPPHPFFRPALVSARPVMAAVIAEGLKEIAEK